MTCIWPSCGRGGISGSAEHPCRAELGSTHAHARTSRTGTQGQHRRWRRLPSRCEYINIHGTLTSIGHYEPHRHARAACARACALARARACACACACVHAPSVCACGVCMHSHAGPAGTSRNIPAPRTRACACVEPNSARQGCSADPLIPPRPQLGHIQVHPDRN